MTENFRIYQKLFGNLRYLHKNVQNPAEVFLTYSRSPCNGRSLTMKPFDIELFCTLDGSYNGQNGRYMSQYLVQIHSKKLHTFCNVTFCGNAVLITSFQIYYIVLPKII